MYVDLHIHSTFSDSSRSPEEIAAIAKARQVSCLSICDHSSIAAYSRFIAACRQNAMRYAIGVEVGGTLRGENYHVLAYHFDRENHDILEFIQAEKAVGDQECEDMIARMSRDYPVLSVEDYQNYERPEEKGGWKYIHYAVAKGLFASYEAAGEFIFPNYFMESPGERSVEEVCSRIRKARGVPVLAHLGYVYQRNPDAFLSFLRDMCDRGIEGIECYYPSHGTDVTKLCLAFCRKNDLRITTGSDCHGAYDKTPGFTIGSMKISRDMLDLRGILEE